MSTSPDCTLTPKQQSVLLALWPCLKSPPRIDVQIGPEGVRLAATFDRTTPGIVFENVRSKRDEIAVAANLDVATVEVDFEKLKVAAGLESAEEAAEVWESIKHMVSFASAATCTVAQRYARDAGEKVPPWDLSVSRPSLVEQLYTAARDVQILAYKVQLNEIEAQLEPAGTTAAAKIALNERWNRYTEDDRLRMAKYDLKRASSPHIMKHIRGLTAWFVQRLFGDRGLENFYSSQREHIGQQRSEENMAPQVGQERELPSNLMDKVLNSYQRIRDSATDMQGEAYRDRLRLYACFFDQMTSLRRKFWQKGSAEQRTLLQYADDKAASIPSGSTRGLKPKQSLQQVAWEWLPEKTGQSRSTVDDAIWKGRQLRTMIALFGDGVLYFVDSQLETE